MVKVVFIKRDGRSREVNATQGLSLMRAAQAADLDMEGTCEGVMACSTCHVIVAEEWYGRLPPPSANEEDMLDLTYGVTGHSRLACQIAIKPEIDGLTVILPQATRNMME
ncbi:MAG: 2Fe-2S iron-sulfur cluster binding domain-containing protein [Rhodospirillaceae bacterium]|nr:MAG: 2Fe-2S iron-sulfur cluster binding domain-containing protein [Rhodospirillaceae bacterium]